MKKGRELDHSCEMSQIWQIYKFEVTSTNFYEVLSLNTTFLIEFPALFPQRQPYVSISFSRGVKFVAIYVLFFG